MTVGVAEILSGEKIAASMGFPEMTPDVYIRHFYPTCPVPPMDHKVYTAAPMVAQIRAGVWIARCACGARKLPAPGCVVFVGTPWGFCIRCLNQGTGGGWRPVVIPDAETRAAIESVLLCRPDVGDRNWEPHESLDELKAQNQAHGDPLPRRKAVGFTMTGRAD